MRVAMSGNVAAQGRSCEIDVGVMTAHTHQDAMTRIRKNLNQHIERLRSLRTRRPNVVRAGDLLATQIEHLRIERRTDDRVTQAIQAAFGSRLSATITILGRDAGVIRLRATHPVHRFNIERLVRSDARIQQILREAGIRRFRWDNDRSRADAVD
jgi:hypothetical protein